MKKITFLLLLVLAFVRVQSQDYEIYFQGTGSFSSLETVYVENLTKGTNVTINGTDAILLVAPTNIDKIDNQTVVRIFPNPLKSSSKIEFTMLSKGQVIIELIDVTGKIIVSTSTFLEAGTHTFEIRDVKSGVYSISISSEKFKFFDKIISQSSSTGPAHIDYLSSNSNAETSNTLHLKADESITTMYYNNGDVMRYTGYANSLSAIVNDVPTGSKVITFSSIGTIPTLTTTAATSITQNTAISGGNISSDGGAIVTVSGICWSTSPSPTISNSKTTTGSTIGLYTGTLSGLSSNTTYYVRAYATNSEGTAYGDEVSFTTSQAQTSALCEAVDNCNVTFTTGGTSNWTGQNSITYDGIDAAKSGTLTSNQESWMQTTVTGPVDISFWWKASSESGYDYLIFYIDGVQQNSISGETTWAQKQYTVTQGSHILKWTYSKDGSNSSGSDCGWVDGVVVTASTTSVPILTTTAVSSISPTTGISGGNITSNGGSTVTVSGVCWSTSPSPTISNNKTTTGSTIGSYAGTLSGLSPNTTYYVRAYATNSIGTGYGNQVSFTTLQAQTSALCEALDNCNITFTTGGTSNWTGQNSVTYDGIDAAKSGALASSQESWMQTTVTGPADISFWWKVSSESGYDYLRFYIDGVQQNSISGEVTWAQKQYFVGQGTHILKWSYAKDDSDYSGSDCGWIDGVVVTASTATVPVLTSTAVSSITPTTAISGGTISSSGSNTVTVSGICWSTSPSPTTVNNKTTTGTTTGTYSGTLTGLTPGTTYYVRAYATNVVGTGYGNQVTFTTTTASIPTLTTAFITSLSSNSAVSGGSITNNGGVAVTVSGICWNTSPSPTILNNKTTTGSTTGSYTGTLTPLLGGTTYYVRAYATNSVGTGYGNEVSFTTPQSIAICDAVDDCNLTFTTGGSISWFGQNSISHDVVDAAKSGLITHSQESWMQTTVTGPVDLSFWWKVSSESGYDYLRFYIDGVQQNSISGEVTWAQKQYFVGQGTHIVKWTYSKDGSSSSGSDCGWVDGVVIAASTATVPVLTSTAVTSIATTTATSGGTISSNGGNAVTVSGICWSTSPSPTTANNKTTNGTTTGAYTGLLTGLTPNTMYYVRAYATNAVGTSYGNEISFTTISATLPTLTTTAISSISENSASSGGNITNNGGIAVTVSGICWSTSPTPTAANSKTTNGSATGLYTSLMTGLVSNTTYYVRAYATNAVGTSYGNEVSFTTLQLITSTICEAVDNCTYTFTTGGSTSWSGQNLVTHDGVDAAKSGVVGTSQETWTETTVVGTTINFWWKVSSESGYDYLKFYIDGVLQNSISGETTWAQKQYTVTQGTHILKWTYSKDGSNSSGSDCGWVDGLTVQ